MRNLCAVIPARYDSTRLAGKPLLKIAGETIIARTYRQTCLSKYLSPETVYVATDDERIATEIERIGGNVFLIRQECLNGTERICYCLPALSAQYKWIVNIQGDEPFIDPSAIDYMIERHFAISIHEPEVVCTTLHTVIQNPEHLHQTSFGKMVVDQKNNILYASRTLIPATKSGQPNPTVDYLTHIGIFIFKRDFLPEFLRHPNTPLQLSEDIEWLKIMEMGYRIKSFLYREHYEIGVNTMEDYNYLVNKYENVAKNNAHC